MKSESDIVLSNPTMCLNCHCIVIMEHPKDADPQTGAWFCPKCSHVYPFQHWKIRKQRSVKTYPPNARKRG